MDSRQEGDNNLGGLGTKTQLHNGLNIIAFFSYLSWLSNLHKAQFDVNQHRFNCSEQYFMFKRAKLFKKNDAAKQIMTETDPKEIKQLGKAVIRNEERDREVWAKHKDIIMAEALAANIHRTSSVERIFSPLTPISWSKPAPMMSTGVQVSQKRGL